MTGSPQTDPRIEAAAEFLLQQFGSKSGSPVPLAGHRLIARRFVAAMDAADEASGVRRVTAQELATMRANERQRCQGRLIAGIRASERSDAEKDLLVGWLERVFSVLAADSPVGGVS